MKYQSYSTGCFQGMLQNYDPETGDPGNAYCSVRTKVSECVPGSASEHPHVEPQVPQPTSKFHFLRSFDALELLMRSDGQPYTLHLRELPSEGVMGRRADVTYQA